MEDHDCLTTEDVEEDMVRQCRGGAESALAV